MSAISMATFGKKEKEDKKKQKKKEKERKQEFRKANSDKGKGLDAMMAYVDENGNLSSTPPDPDKAIVINAEDIAVGVVKKEDLPPVVRTGRLNYFNEAKGYGFIKDAKSDESFFVHINNLPQPISLNDKVTFMTEHTAKGMAAIQVSKSK